MTGRSAASLTLLGGHKTGRTAGHKFWCPLMNTGDHFALAHVLPVCKNPSIAGMNRSCQWASWVLLLTLIP